MGYEEVERIESIEILYQGTLQIKRAKRVLRDGEEIAKTYFRYCIDAGGSLEEQDPLIVALANAAWPILFPDGIPQKPGSEGV